MRAIAAIALFFCLSVVSIHALEKCPGAARDSQEDFQWKFDAAPIVVFGTVSDVRSNMASFTINCVLKGSLSLNKLELAQMPEVTNLTECHYLTANKKYIVFLDTMKTSAPDSKTLYKLADMEEIEVNSNTVTSFLNDECADEDDEGLEMTMFVADNNLQCNRYTATCNKATKDALLAQNLPPLTKSTTFLGGFKKTMPVPNGNSNDGAVSGKKTGGTGDDDLRAAATTSTMWTAMIVFFAGLMLVSRM